MKTASVLLALLPTVPALLLAFAPAPFPRPMKVRRVEVGKKVTLEIEGTRVQRRRVIVASTVCFREGVLEHLLTRKGRKEHEAILTADIDARHLHTALLLAGATPRAPATFHPGFVPASGDVIRITLEWMDGVKQRRALAGEWVRNRTTKKPMAHDWVFGGSQFVVAANQPGRYYWANNGDVICLANFEQALLDLPVESSASGDKMLYEAFTANIPPLNTEVSVVLERLPKPQR